MNEDLAPKSSLDLTLTQHPRDEDLEPWNVCIHLEVDPSRAWYYRIYPNFHTLVILLQLNSTFGDEHKIVCKGHYET
jgi:hypothetical protein